MRNRTPSDFNLTDDDDDDDQTMNSAPPTIRIFEKTSSLVPTATTMVDTVGVTSPPSSAPPLLAVPVTFNKETVIEQYATDITATIQVRLSVTARELPIPNPAAATCNNRHNRGDKKIPPPVVRVSISPSTDTIGEKVPSVVLCDTTMECDRSSHPIKPSRENAKKEEEDVNPLVETHQRAHVLEVIARANHLATTGRLDDAVVLLRNDLQKLERTTTSSRKDKSIPMGATVAEEEEEEKEKEEEEENDKEEEEKDKEEAEPEWHRALIQMKEDIDHILEVGRRDRRERKGHCSRKEEAEEEDSKSDEGSTCSKSSASSFLTMWTDGSNSSGSAGSKSSAGSASSSDDDDDDDSSCSRMSTTTKGSSSSSSSSSDDSDSSCDEDDSCSQSIASTESSSGSDSSREDGSSKCSRSSKCSNNNSNKPFLRPSSSSDRAAALADIDAEYAEVRRRHKEQEAWFTATFTSKPACSPPTEVGGPYSPADSTTSNHGCDDGNSSSQPSRRFPSNTPRLKMFDIKI